MAAFDGRLIDPTEEELARALGTAMKAANRANRHQANRMTRDAAFWGRFAQDVLRGGAEGRRRSCKGGRAVPEVIAGWWTDPAGRKHVRVVGRTRQPHARLRGEVELRALPPWWHVYPEAVLGVRAGSDGERYFAVCRCGAVGAPGSLGWMGDTCGPCFDRRADGGAPSGGFGQFAGWLPALARFGFTADGHLIGQNQTGGFQKVNRTDGAPVTAKRRSVNHLAALGTSASGTVMVMQEGSAFRWRADSDEVEPVLFGRRMWGRVALTPDGSRVAVISYQFAYIADLTTARPRYIERPAPEGVSAVQFTSDGSRLLALTFQGEVRALNPNSLAAEVVRRDAFDGMPAGYGPPTEMAVSGDGSAVLLRRESYYPRRVCVRHVPLPAGKVVELRLPDWHRATTLAYSPDGRHAVTAESEGGWVGFWDLASGKSLGFVRAVLEDLAWRSGQVEFAPDGAAVAVSYNSAHKEHGSTVAVWPWPEVLAAAGEG
ncbi:WD40 repeat domain-containing protein [Frigoriglobus tundricola]|uniref:WD40 repeat domain-containing protein n=1 Tax=Frigoriglobus tundricola TaxID=2774151 RepID=A0A6M5YNN0_9BACT|nr:WD40 repeat domain-containing protein [Frigoriglobus tundricola]QJW94861.1 hypothetical protein FTUN_2387 [Frigoriglobus tundricola]